MSSKKVDFKITSINIKKKNYTKPVFDIEKYQFVDVLTGYDFSKYLDKLNKKNKK